ncbi:glutamyl-tRNA reductase [Malaciobacter molluscorum LMG 25693]|uniref:Glutamyl-tRNA reductase n=1 Tax=Malaciobacter molluscorum LMG 25693 TaxID=870501 RepID=A0A2G1DJV7_9BACT|nr:glutamyl-tRNA reductase [Malaciobacter molluscorum]AXX91450.1 glutamyl-tRNA reductase [Malaciobacter molluscorum LMG 25693]PHO18803.1 glutamyl-tRNA reductase [Malaciobacter molluscorum LMG 25693]
MSYLVISFSHKNTDIQMREKLAFPNEEDKDRFLKYLTSEKAIKEAIILSTCNRVEIIIYTVSVSYATEIILERLASYSGIEFDDLMQRADVYDNDGAIHHLFSVASALDSLVIGETQIVGQLKDSFRFSLGKGYCHQSLPRALHYAFKCAAAVRTATTLGTGSVSVASTAVLKAKEEVGNKEGIKALVIGAGEMSELTVKHLISKGFKVVLTSRDIKKATILAQTFEENVQVENYANLKRLLNEIPVMITATSAPYPIITQNMVEECNFDRYWFDIAVPRDIDDIESDNLNIFTVDDLQFIVNANMALKAKQAKTAFGIVGKMSAEFFDWLKTLEVEPVLKHLYLRGEEVIDKKVNNAIKKGFINREDEENIRKLCQTVLKEYLHQPSRKIKHLSKNMECDIVLGAVQSMFELKSDSNMLNKYRCDHALNINERG